jgi:hypothetical protein
VIEVLVDEVDEEGTIARSKADAPEIDGLVYLDGHFDAQPGDFLQVRSSMPTTMTSTPSLSEQLKGIVGAAYVLTDPAEIRLSSPTGAAVTVGARAMRGAAGQYGRGGCRGQGLR